MQSISVVFSFAMLSFCASYKILAIFPYNGRSHHIYFSSLVEELASRENEVTVINYFPVKEYPNLRRISLQNESTSDFVDMEHHLKNLHNWFKEIYSAYDTARAFRIIANLNCERLMNNKEIRDMVESNAKFDVIIVEQFVTDCGLALAHKVGGPVVGMTAHILMPWSYARLGATNNPAFVPNHFFATGTKPDLITKTKSALMNLFLNFYFKNVIQNIDYEIVKKVYPETPDLEALGRNISLILINQYFPLTGSRIYGVNVIEVGGMHIRETNEVKDKELNTFMNNTKHGIVYISFGTVAKSFPHTILDAIIKFLSKSNMKFIWKLDDVDLKVPKNTLLRKWLPQPAILCHTNVVAFITHSGMLSSSEAMHCGVPIVSVPMFGDQFANSAAAVENGLGVSVDAATLDESVLEEALNTVLQERYQKRAKQLSEHWRDRPLSPMDTAIFWIYHVAKHKGVVDMKPPTVDLPLYQYLLIDVIVLILSFIFFIFYLILKIRYLILQLAVKKNENLKKKNL